jgi:hypothetical protein
MSFEDGADVERVARRIVLFRHKFFACDVLATWSPLWRSWGWFVSWSLYSFLLFQDGFDGFEKFEDKSWVFKNPKTRLKCTVQGFFFLRRDDC